jgi:hypothetical protein
VSIDALSETYKIDESLDSSVLTIPRSLRKENFKRFSPVKIQIVDGATTYTHWWLNYKSKSSIESFGITSKYSHILALIEPTKILEKYICGTLTFTQPLGGTQYTLKEVVDRVLLLTPFKKYSKVATTRICTLDSTLATYLDKIIAPQIYLDKKNLREALIEIFKYVNAIPRLVFNGSTWVLTADFINNRNINITVDTGLLDYVNEANSDDFSQRAEIFHENTIPTEDEDSPNLFESSITDVITFRNDESLIIGDSNFYLTLSQKVFKKISIKMIFATSTNYYLLDMDNYILPSDVFKSLDFDNSETNFRGSQRCSAYWTYGSNIIGGFDTGYGIFGLNLSIENIIQDAVLLQYSTTISVNYTLTSKYNISFLVEYIPFIELDRSEQLREDNSDFELTDSFNEEETAIIINEKERLNSLYKLTKNIYGQIQRVGVNTIAFSLKHKTLSPYDGTNEGIYSQGDYTNDGYFVTTVEIIYFNAFVIARYEMSKNFNRIAQFVNINKEFRPYEITLTKSDYTLKRDIIARLFFIEINSITSAYHNNNIFVTDFMNTFGDSLYEPSITSATFKTSDTSGTYGNNGVFLPLILLAEKNTIKFKLDFKDTKLVGKRVIYAVNDYQKQVIYTEDDGTIDFCEVSLYKNYWEFLERIYAATSLYAQGIHMIGNNFPYVDTSKNIATDEDPSFQNNFITANVYETYGGFPVTGTENQYYLDQETNRVYKYTALSGYSLSSNAVAIKNNYVYKIPEYEILKDKSEIVGISMVLPIIPNKNKINQFIIGDMLSKDNVLIKKRIAKQLYFQVSSTFYSKSKTDNTNSTTNFLDFDNSYIGSHYIDVPSSVYAEDNYAITDESGNLYLAVNQMNLDGTKTVISRIYFNFIEERS